MRPSSLDNGSTPGPISSPWQWAAQPGLIWRAPSKISRRAILSRFRCRAIWNMHAATFCRSLRTLLKTNTRRSLSLSLEQRKISNNFPIFWNPALELESLRFSIDAFYPFCPLQTAIYFSQFRKRLSPRSFWSQIVLANSLPIIFQWRSSLKIEFGIFPSL